MTDAERVLRAQLADRLADAEALNASLADVRSARSDGTADDEHDPEGSTLSSDWSQMEGLSRSTRDRIAEIERALRRIQDGSYGTCLSCAAPIPPARLEARPAAERCVACASQ